MIRHFASVAELRREAISVPNHLWSAGSLAGETWEETQRYSELGNVALVPEAERMMDALETQIAVPRRQWHRSPAGAYPCVPEAIAGLPTSMRRSIYEPDEFAPISIYVRPNAHADIDGTMLRKRGIAILALTMALLRTRPVSLHYFFVGDGQGYSTTTLCTRIETAPLDLATAAYVLTSPAFYRVLCIGLAYKLNRFRGAQLQSDKTGERIAREMGAEPERTLVVGVASRYDPIITDPIAWINAQIARFVGEQEEAA